MKTCLFLTLLQTQKELLGKMSGLFSTKLPGVKVCQARRKQIKQILLPYSGLVNLNRETEGSQESICTPNSGADESFP